jgi:hypothetical protein
MKNKSTLSVRDLTEIIRDCQSPMEIECVISDIRSAFDHYSLSDQAFLMALIGVTLMTITVKEDPLNGHKGEMHLSQLLSLNWRAENVR